MMRRAWFVGAVIVTLAVSGCAPSWSSVPAMSDQIALPIAERFVPRPDPTRQLSSGLSIEGSSSVYALCRTIADAECGGTVVREPKEDPHPEAGGVLIEVAIVGDGRPRVAPGLPRALIARDAFVFVTHRDNPVTSLSLQQVRDIYAGQITNWKDVGGRSEPIVAFQRSPGVGIFVYDDSPSFVRAGSQDVMRAWVMDGAEMMPPPSTSEWHGYRFWETTAEYRNLPNALGYTFRWHAAVLNADPQVKLLAVDGVEPSDENLASGRYPLTIDVTAVTEKRPPAKVTRFLTWVTGPDGRALIRKAGYTAP